MEPGQDSQEFKNPAESVSTSTIKALPAVAAKLSNRCLFCDYPLVGLSSTRCPECGNVPPPEIADLDPRSVLPWELLLRRNTIRRLATFVAWCAFRFPTFLRAMRARVDRPIYQASRLIVGLAVLVVITPTLITLIQAFVQPVVHWWHRPRMIWPYWRKYSLWTWRWSIDGWFFDWAITATEILVLTVVLWGWLRVRARPQVASNVVVLTSIPMFLVEVAQCTAMAAFVIVSTWGPWWQMYSFIRFYVAVPLTAAIILRFVWKERLPTLVLPVTFVALANWLSGMLISMGFAAWVNWKVGHLIR